MTETNAKLANLETEVKWLKIIIPACAALVALLVLVFWGVEHKSIGKRVSAALEETTFKEAELKATEALGLINQQLEEAISIRKSVEDEAQKTLDTLLETRRKVPWVDLDILSVDHSSGTQGLYFNYNNKALDEAFGSDWSGRRFAAIDTNSQIIGTVVLWNTVNGASRGDGHGRWVKNSHHDEYLSTWVSDSSILIISGPGAPDS